jgi:hypothetical protein
VASRNGTHGRGPLVERENDHGVSTANRDGHQV